MTSAQARENATAAIVQAARVDSSVFTDAFFGYESAPFQREWHSEWGKPDARVVQWAPVEHGKTQRATGFVLHRLGQNPVNERVLWIGSSAEAAYKSTGIVRTAIEKPTPFLRAVFPGLRQGSDKWTQATFSVAGVKRTEKDYSVQAAGVGKQILGGRYTLVVLDDVLNFDTTYTSAQRSKMVKWFFSQIPGRMLDGGRILILGNAWYPDDLMHAAAERGYTVIREEAYRETDDGQIVPDSLLWPAQWSLERLARKRKELGTIEALRQLRCQPYSAGQGRFRMEWFDAAMQAGEDLSFVEGVYSGEWGPAFMGLDLGVSQKEGSDLTADWVMAVNPKNQQRRLLWTEEDRLTGPEIVGLLQDRHRRFQPVTMVENNAAQDFIRQFAGAAGVPTRPFTTGKNKADPAFGVPSLGVELEQGMWILPGKTDREKRAAIRWRTQCLAYAPGQHTGDTLMASWFAREAARGGIVVSATSKAPPQRPYADPARRFGRGGRGPGLMRRG